jgi:hypothetical protein
MKPILSKFIPLLATALLYVSCADLGPLITRDELLQSRAAIREKTIRAFPELSDADREIIRTNDTPISYYKTGGLFCSYSESWTITSNRVIRACGDGIITNAENLAVSLYAKDPGTGKEKLIETRK